LQPLAICSRLPSAAAFQPAQRLHVTSPPQQDLPSPSAVAERERVTSRVGCVAWQRARTRWLKMLSLSDGARAMEIGHRFLTEGPMVAADV